MFALVMMGASVTLSVKFCVAFGVTPLLAVNVSGYTPPVPALGVPVKTPVAVIKVTPAGNVPVLLSVGAG